MVKVRIYRDSRYRDWLSTNTKNAEPTELHEVSEKFLVRYLMAEKAFNEVLLELDQRYL